MGAISEHQSLTAPEHFDLKTTFRFPPLENPNTCSLTPRIPAFPRILKVPSSYSKVLDIEREISFGCQSTHFRMMKPQQTVSKPAQ